MYYSLSHVMKTTLKYVCKMPAHIYKKRNIYDIWKGFKKTKSCPKDFPGNSTSTYLAVLSQRVASGYLYMFIMNRRIY